MEAATRAGRIIGVLILLQMVGGGIVNFVLEAPLFGQPGFLESAASHSQQIGLAVVLGLITEALGLGVAVTACPIFFQRARTIALWLGALAVVSLAVTVIENTAVMSMVSVSQAYAAASVVERQQLETVRVLVASARNWPHFVGRMFDGGFIFVFYAALFRLALVPRALAGLGLIAAALLVTGVGMPLFGHEVVFPLLAPMGLSQLALSLWLLMKGFGSQPGPGGEQSDR
jgi:hypothetical protein